MSNIEDLQRRRDAQLALEVDPPGQPMPNARRFVGAKFDHREHALLVNQGGQFYRWDGTCWPTVEDAMLRADLYKWFEDRHYVDDTKKEPVRKPFAPTMRKTADLLDALRAITIVPTNTPSPSWLANGTLPANELIACSNGLVHWPTRTLYPHTPTYYTHHSVPFAFEPRAPRPARWLTFLGDLWGGDDRVDALQELFGYLVSGGTEQQKMFLFVGPRRGGKGTIARVLTRMLGSHNVAGPTLSTLGTNFGLQDLIGKPVAVISDARLGAKTDSSLVTERLLSITGEDLQNVDRKYAAPWSGYLPTRFVVLTNELPRLTDSSGALAGRFIVWTMSISFYGRENPGLTDELCTELPAIFNWALDGLQRLRARGRFVQPQASQDAIRQLEDLGSPVGAFIRDRCDLGGDRVVPCDELYRAWGQWCEDNGRHKTNTQVFGRDLRASRPEIQVRQLGADRKRHYAGIGLADSRDSRVNIHCSTDAPTGFGQDPAALDQQCQITRESRECGLSEGIPWT